MTTKGHIRQLADRYAERLDAAIHGRVVEMQNDDTNNPSSRVVLGDCLDELSRTDEGVADLVYLDPPFFTNRQHSSVTRGRDRTYSFNDSWTQVSDYVAFMESRLKEIRRVLKPTGSVFLHCDSNANYLLRQLLDQIFGPEQFRSEIIWTYRRWSNSAKNLLPAHQTIFFYSKTAAYKFHKVFGDYSQTTNVDQILQLRARDEHGVARYARDEHGEVLMGSAKNGVPLSDVWEIPFLNPKAKERTGYPTQKPVLLLERIVSLVTDPGDLVVDPFCGSGTALVAAAILGRNSFGIDCSAHAVELAWARLLQPCKTESSLLRKGRNAYVNADSTALGLLAGLDLVPVHRNAGIDAFWRVPKTALLVPIRVQRSQETLADAANALYRAAASKRSRQAVLVRTHENGGPSPRTFPQLRMEIVDATAVQANERISRLAGNLAGVSGFTPPLQRARP